MSSDARELLSELRGAENPNACLMGKYQSSTNQEKQSLNELIGELEHNGYLSVLWGDDIAYHITLKRVNDADINGGTKNILIIGDNNRIKDSNIGVNNIISEKQEKKRFWEKHPFALALITAIIAAFIMMFSFWGQLVAFIEGLFS